MTREYKAPRGTQDVLPQDQTYWDLVRQTAARIAAAFGYARIETPVFEDATLFTRGVGEVTDIVQKEVYVFQDRGGRGLGRSGEADASVDAEVIELLWRVCEELGLTGLTLQLNSIGDPTCRPRYLDALRDYYRDKLDRVCGDCRARFERNPLRLLDCKQPQCQPVIARAPAISDYLCDDCAAHFADLRSYLEAAGISHELNPRLVRGLDYYTRTVFEIQPPEEGSQSSIGGGGRYDGLIEQLGGRPTPGGGFGSGRKRHGLQ